MKVKFTTNIDEKLLKAIKMKAIEENRNVNEIIEELLEKYLKGGKEMLDTYFDKEKLIIITNENGGMNEYKYEYFQEGFEEWANDLEITIADAEHLKRYLAECGYQVIDIREVNDMKKTVVECLEVLKEEDLLNAIGEKLAEEPERFPETIENMADYFVGQSKEYILDKLSTSSLVGADDELAIQEWIAGGEVHDL